MGIKITSADRWFSLYIRARDGWSCQRCGRGYREYIEGGDNRHLMGLHCMHCHGRGSKSTRFEPDNSASGCYGCHSYLDGHPEEKRQFFIGRVGKKRYDELHRLSKKPYRNFKKEQRQISKEFKEKFYAIL